MPTAIAFDTNIGRQFINSLVMSLAAVPAYLLARRVVGQWPALLAAVLAGRVLASAVGGRATEGLGYSADAAALIDGRGER